MGNAIVRQRSRSTSLVVENPIPSTYTQPISVSSSSREPATRSEILAKTNVRSVKVRPLLTSSSRQSTKSTCGTMGMTPRSWPSSSSLRIAARPFGLFSAVVALGIFWMINGWFQGMGFPPCARAFTHWVPPRELATKMSIWNASTNIGAGLVVVMCSYLLTYFGNWRLCFFVPAAIAFLCSVFLWFALPDTPPSAGLPEVEGTQTKTVAGESDDWKAVAVKYVFSNPYVWLLAVANFFVYTIRYAVLDWGPTLLTQAKHLQLTNAGWMVAGFELSGMTGALIGCWLTDRLFGGRGFRSCVFYMAMAGISILLFWKVAGESVWLNTLLLCCSGFFIYGPQCLISIAAATLAPQRAAATAVGLTGIFGYASTTLSGVGLGKLVQTYGWDAGFIGMLIIAAIGTFVCALGWKAKAHGYGD